MRTLSENASSAETIRTLNELIIVLQYIDPIISNRCGQAAPPASMLRDGKLAYADGVNWKPNGTGAKGLWRYNTTGTAWIFVG